MCMCVWMSGSGGRWACPAPNPTSHLSHSLWPVYPDALLAGLVGFSGPSIPGLSYVVSSSNLDVLWVPGSWLNIHSSGSGSNAIGSVPFSGLCWFRERLCGSCGTRINQGTGHTCEGSEQGRGAWPTFEALLVQETHVSSSLLGEARLREGQWSAM